MAIFDSTKKQILTYYIHLTDRALVEEYQARWPNGVNLAPTKANGPALGGSRGAAEYFEAPFRGYTEPAAGLAPFTWTPNGKDEDDRPYPLWATRFSQTSGGFFGVGGTTLEYYWMGQFVLAQEGAADPDLVPADGLPGTCKRLWIEGFETGITGGGGFNSAGFQATPDASRHPGGMGLAMRSTTASTTYNTTAHVAAIPGAKTWERFYIRLRKLPSATVWIHEANGATTAGLASLLGITATGQLALGRRAASASPHVFISAIDAGLEVWTGLSDHLAWKRIDLIHRLGANPAYGECTVYVNGSIVATIQTDNDQARHASSSLGCIDSVANTLEIDFDDWICSEWLDANESARLAYSKEFNGGSKIVLSRAKSFGGAHGTWVGDYRVTAQNPGTSTSTTPLQAMTSITSGAIAEVTLDAEYRADNDPQAIGVGGIRTQVMATRGTTSGSIGYSLAGGAAVPLVIAETGILNQFLQLYSPNTAQAVDPQFADVTPLNIRYTKGADVTSASLWTLTASIELIGKFGPEDYTATELGDVDMSALGSTGTHNYPYPTSPWARRGSGPPVSPYITWGGTYVGNGTGQDISFRAPVHWLYVRPLTGGTGGYFWTSAMIGAHKNTAEAIAPQVVDVGENTAYVGTTGGGPGQQQEYRLRLVGNESQINQTGVTYQYIAISDPGMRYMLNGDFSAGSGTGDTSRPLANPSFTPEFMFLFGEQVAGTATVRLYGKSSGQATESIVSSSGTVVASALAFGAGSITTKAAIHSATPRHWAYSGFRKQDGSSDTGEARVVFFGTYTGDGSASRTIGLAPSANRRPMFCAIFSETAVGLVRDPSHTGTTSSTFLGVANAATGITAGGIDSFTVGLVANANGVVYSYFGLYGSDACTSSGGWGCNAENTPVEPAAPTQNGAFAPMPTEPEEFDPDDEDTDGDGDGGGEWAGGPPTTPVDFSAECYQWSTYMANLALGKIGSSKQITDIRTDTSEEAYKARLVYALDVERVLRDHPWPFATRYSNLVLVSGSAATGVNQDWQYSYRVPTNFLFARRIVGPDQQKRAWDVEPQQFKIGSDAIGLLIYSNEPATVARPLQLEYTIRMTCPAQQGDAIFRSALVWKLASSLAATIAKDAKKAEECEVMYLREIEVAKLVAVREQQHDNNPGDASWITGR